MLKQEEAGKTSALLTATLSHLPSHSVVCLPFFGPFPFFFHPHFIFLPIQYSLRTRFAHSIKPLSWLSHLDNPHDHRSAACKAVDHTLLWFGNFLRPGFYKNRPVDRRIKEIHSVTHVEPCIDLNHHRHAGLPVDTGGRLVAGATIATYCCESFRYGRRRSR